MTTSRWIPAHSPRPPAPTDTAMRHFAIHPRARVGINHADVPLQSPHEAIVAMIGDLWTVDKPWQRGLTMIGGAATMAAVRMRHRAAAILDRLNVFEALLWVRSPLPIHAHFPILCYHQLHDLD